MARTDNTPDTITVDACPVCGRTTTGLTIYAVVYDREIGDRDTVTEYDPDLMFAAQDTAQRQCDTLNAAVVERANRYAQSDYRRHHADWEKRRVLVEAGLEKWVGTEPTLKVYALDSLPTTEAYRVEPIKVNP
jgi:hypothetical protein